MGLCTVFLRFVPNLAHVAAPLKIEILKDQVFKFGELNEDKLTAREDLKTTLVNPLVLTLPS